MLSRMLLVVVGLLSALPLQAQENSKFCRVFILAGQSNMEGKAKVALCDYQVGQAKTAPLFEGLRDGDKWRERDDVFVKFFDRKGKLTVGYGSPNCIGPELGIGQALGDRYEERILLIKTAWGGRSLLRDFRSPSAGSPPKEKLEQWLNEARKNKPDTTEEEIANTVGRSYREMLEEIRATMADLKSVSPELEGYTPRISGFIWFQGWNDMIDPVATSEYTVNLRHFIRDVRKDLDEPLIPFVIGQMGVDGTNPNDGIKKFKEAQAAVLEDEGLRASVGLVKTDIYWDTDADTVYKAGWRQNLELWNQVGSDYPFHYLGSPKTMLGIGRALGKETARLLDQTP